MKKYPFLFSLFLASNLACLPLDAAQTVSPTEHVSVPNEEIQNLDLSYVYGGDFVHGQPFDESELIQKIALYPNLKELNLTGQPITPALMASIRDHLPKLEKLVIKGSIRFNNGDGDYYSHESINNQEISDEAFQEAFLNESNIEILDLSLSHINDHSLSKINNAPHLRELYLRGVTDLTDQGILTIVNNLPNIKLIDVSSVTLRQPYGNWEKVGPEVSQELIKELREKGIFIIQND